MLWLAVATPDIPDAVQLLQEMEREELSRVDPDGTAARAAELGLKREGATRNLCSWRRESSGSCTICG